MNPIKIKWDLLIICFAVYNSISLPLELALVPPFLAGNQHIDILNQVIDFIFFIDIVLSFRTSIVNPMSGEEITDTKIIYMSYLTGRFWIDLISTIPFDLIVQQFENDLIKQNSRKFVLLSCMKLIRILRLSRIIDYLKSSDEFKL